MITREDRLKLFVNEIGDIQDGGLRKLAEEIIANADEYFFTVAASTTGKYHPQFDLGLGGLIRHTRCVIYFAEALATSSMLSEHDKDLLIIAALAHDIKKLGNNGSKYTVKDHPTLAKEYVEAIASKNDGLITREDLNKVKGAIESHMGIWGHKDGLPLPTNEFEKILQNADYVASRKEILDFDFRPTEGVVLTEETAAPFMSGDLKDYVIQFGKHKGKTLEEIRPTGYLNWMVGQTDFFNKEAQDIARRYLDSLNAPQPQSQPMPSMEIVDDLPF